MATQYSFENIYSTPEFEYQTEVLKKRFHSTKANFAYLKFKRSMQMRLSVVDNP